MDDLPLEAGEEVLGSERCAMAPRTAVLARGSLVAVAVMALTLVAALASGGGPRLVLLAVAAVALVTAIPLAWFAFVRWLEDPRVRAVTSLRAIEIAHCGDVHEIRLARVTGVKARTTSGVVPAATPEDWTSAIGLEIEGADGRRFVMASAQAPEIGPALLRALTARGL